MPVEPEVNTIATRWLQSICGIESVFAADFHFGIAQLGQVYRTRVTVGETKRIRCKNLDLTQRSRGVCRRQQADFTNHDGRCQPHAEAVPVAAQIKQMEAGRKPAGKVPDIRQELPQRDGAIGAPGHDAVRGEVRYQRQ
jgi:hypothetical protein